MKPRATAEGVGLAAVTLAYLATRSWRLTALPMFFDEAIHILWGHRWQGLSRAMADGKLLQVMASGAATRLLPEDALWAVRMATVLVGLVTLWAAFWLGRRLGGPPGGLVSAALVVASPFFLFHDRMGLADPFVSAFSSLALVATIRLCDEPSPRRGTLLGLTLAAAGASKVIGLLAVFVSVAGVALLSPRKGRAWRALAVASGVAAALLWIPTRAFFHSGAQVSEKAALGVEDPWALLLHNVATLGEWLWIYWTPTVLIAGLVVTVRALSRRHPVEWLLVTAWILPLILFVVGARLWYPRYVLFATVPFVALLGGALGEAWSRSWSVRARTAVVALLVGLLVPGLLFEGSLLRDPATAPLPPVDRWQYVEGWPSGYGWEEAHEFLVKEMGPGASPRRIVTDPYHWTLKASFVGRPGVVVKGFDVARPPGLARATRWLGSEGGWLVVSAPPASRGTSGREVTHVAGFTKPGRRFMINVYRLE